MVQRRGGPRFALKAFQRLAIASQIGGQELEGDLSAEPKILGPVDRPHSAFAKLLEDSIVADRRPDHGWLLLGSGFGETSTR
jgi:hypothetical protein